MTVERKSLSELSADMGSSPIDLFVGSTSFEERCLSIASHLEASLIRRAMIAVNVTHRTSVEGNILQFRERFSECIKEVEVYSDDPIASAREIDQSLECNLRQSQHRIVIDISTFTRESLLMLLYFLRKHVSASDEIIFLYANAEEYSVGDPWDKKWLSKGVREVRSVLGFPGEMFPSRPTHLVMMIGFEDDRALELIQRCQPTFASLGVADSSEFGTRPHQEINVDRFRRLRSVLDRVDEFTFSAYNPELAKVAVDGQIRKYKGCNVVVAPMHTKVSTVGAALAAVSNRSVQLCYASAQIYNVARYSSPGNEYYRFKLPSSFFSGSV